MEFLAENNNNNKQKSSQVVSIVSIRINYTALLKTNERVSVGLIFFNNRNNINY